MAACYRVKRYRDQSGQTLFFAVSLGSRSRGWRFFKPGEVPEFDGESATFEVTIRRGAWSFGARLDQAATHWRGSASKGDYGVSSAVSGWATG